MCTARVFGILVLFAERTIKRQSPPSTCCRRPRGHPSLSFLLATRFVVVWSAPSPPSGSRLWPTKRHEACESPRDATFSFSRRVGFLSYRAFDLQPMPGRYARAELSAGKTARRGMHLSCSRILFQLQNVRSPPRFLSLSKADAGRPWAPAVAQEAQGRFRLTPLCEFSPLCYGYRTPPL